jgi:hypothetical protein
VCLCACDGCNCYEHTPRVLLNTDHIALCTGCCCCRRRFTQDHTCYKFEAATLEDLPDIKPPGTASRQHSGRRRQQSQQQPGPSAAGAATATAGGGAAALPSGSQRSASAGPDRYLRLPSGQVGVQQALDPLLAADGITPVGA